MPPIGCWFLLLSITPSSIIIPLITLISWASTIRGKTQVLTQSEYSRQEIKLSYTLAVTVVKYLQFSWWPVYNLKTDTVVLLITTAWPINVQGTCSILSCFFFSMCWVCVCCNCKSVFIPVLSMKLVLSFALFSWF